MMIMIRIINRKILKEWKWKREGEGGRWRGEGKEEGKRGEGKESQNCRLEHKFLSLSTPSIPSLPSDVGFTLLPPFPLVYPHSSLPLACPPNPFLFIYLFFSLPPFGPLHFNPSILFNFLFPLLSSLLQSSFGWCPEWLQSWRFCQKFSQYIYNSWINTCLWIEFIPEALKIHYTSLW